MKKFVFIALIIQGIWTYYSKQHSETNNTPTQENNNTGVATFKKF